MSRIWTGAGATVFAWEAQAGGSPWIRRGVIVGEPADMKQIQVEIAFQTSKADEARVSFA